MPLADLTLDTNVLLHSHNPIETRHLHAVKLLRKLLACSTKLAVDDGFDVDPARNRSLIGAEYLAKLVPGSLPMVVLTQLALNKRISFVNPKLPAQLSRKLNQLVANRRDRTFIKVSCGSSGKTLVTHDFEDFTNAKRGILEEIFVISILEAEACVDVL